MGLKILGIDVSDKSTDEVRNIVQHLGIDKLSSESLEMLSSVDDSIKESWIRDHDTITPFTDESVKDILSRMEVVSVSSSRRPPITDFHDLSDDEKETIFSKNFEKQLKRIDASGYKQAFEKYEDPLDRKAAHYDYVHFIIENTFTDLPSEVVDYVSEQTVDGSYDYRRNQYIEEMAAEGRMLDPYVLGDKPDVDIKPNNYDKMESLPENIFGDDDVKPSARKQSTPNGTIHVDHSAAARYASGPVGGDISSPVSNGNVTNNNVFSPAQSGGIVNKNINNTKNQKNQSMFTDGAMDKIRSSSFYSKEEQESIVASGRNSEDKDLINGLITSSVKNTRILENGGKIVFKQLSGDTKDAGSYLQSRVSDIETAVGDELGIEDDDTQNIFITPSTPIGLYSGDVRNSFLVIYSDKIPHDSHGIISDIVKDELSQKGFEVETGNVYNILESELKTVNTNYSSENDGSVFDTRMLDELKHADAVLNDGYGMDGYNSDGYDETGHSADGEYNAMYDKSFTDQGPEL